MKSSKNYVLAAVATLGLAVVAAPVIAQQTHMQHGGMMGSGANMMGDSDHMTGSYERMGSYGGMGMMIDGARTRMMATFDTDDDGTLTPEELAAGIQAELSTYDTDSNGTLSLEEFSAMHVAHIRPMTVRAFQMHDPDGDAQVTAAEMTVMMQSHMGGQQGHPPGIDQRMRDND